MYVEFTVSLYGITLKAYKASKSADRSLRQLIAVHAGIVCGAGCSACHSGDMTTESVTEFKSRRAGGVRVKLALHTASAAKEGQAQVLLDTYLNSKDFKKDVVKIGGVLAKVTGTNVESAPHAMEAIATPGKGGKSDSGKSTNSLAITLSVICGLLLCSLIAGGIYFVHFKNKDSLGARMAAVQMEHNEELELEDQDGRSGIPTQVHTHSALVPGTADHTALPMDDTSGGYADATPPKYEDEPEEEEESLTKNVS